LTYPIEPSINVLNRYIFIDLNVFYTEEHVKYSRNVNLRQSYRLSIDYEKLMKIMEMGDDTF